MTKVTKAYSDVGPCPVCGCDLPDGKCATVTLLEPYDTSAAEELKAQDYELESPVGAYFALANLPLVKAARERQKAQEEARKNAPSYVNNGGKTSVYQGTKKDGFRTETHKFSMPAHQMLLYVLKFLHPTVPPEEVKNEDLNHIVRNYDADMTPSEMRKRYYMTGTDEEGGLYIGVMIEPKEANDGYTQSTWSFSIVERKLRIRNVFSDKTGFATTEWFFNIFS